MFRSTSPGSELEGWDDQGNAKLKDGAWLYESLRFHGLYGVRKMELANFLKGLIGEFNAKHWNLQHDHKQATAHSTANPE